MKRILISCGIAAMILSCSGGGGGGGGASPGGGTTITAPAAPSGISVVAGDRQTTISWDAVSGADSYNLYWKLASGVTLTDTTVSGVTSTFTHTGLTNGYTYHYAVTAVNPAGESALSAEASGMPKLPAGTFTREVAFTSGMDAWGAAEDRIMNLYLASGVKGSGFITAITVRHLQPLSAPAACPAMTIKMGHTDRTALQADFGSNVERGQGAFQTVFSGTVTVPAGGSNAYYTIPLAQPFYYNGTDNLVVEFAHVSACSPLAYTVSHAAPYDGVVFATGAGSSTAATGAVFASVTDAKFHFTGGDTIAVDASTTTNYFPWNNDTAGRKVQLLYRADEINGSGWMTGIGFRLGQLSVEGAYTYNLKIGHTNLTTLTATFADNFNSGEPVAAAEAVSYTIPAGIPPGAYVWIPLPDGVFNYDGANNLVVEIEVTSASARNYWGIDNSGGSRLYATAGAATGAVNEMHYSMKFRFAGATADVLSDGIESDPRFFPSGDANGAAMLYRASELGTRGVIRSISCRSSLGTAAGSYPSYRVIMGHTTAGLLTDTSDFADQAIVYDGAFSIPAGLQRGDWITIPLTTPFAYDGERNLIVWMGTTAAGGSGVNGCTASDTDAVRYPDQTSIGAPGTSYSMPADLKVDMRMEIQR